MIQQALFGSQLLANGFDPRLFVAIVVSGMFSIIGLYFFSIKLMPRRP